MNGTIETILNKLTIQAVAVVGSMVLYYCMPCEATAGFVGLAFGWLFRAEE